MKNSVLVSLLAIISTCAAQFDPEQCGPTAGNQKCQSNKCCSQYGWCGTTNAYCRADRGCQSGFGRCTGAVSPASSSVSRASSSVAISLSSTRTANTVASSAPVSTNGRCGSAYGGKTCLKSAFGNCCSQYNWCGSTSDHCKASSGCQPGFGTCSAIASSSSSATRSSSAISSKTSSSSSARTSQSSSRSSSASSSSSVVSSASTHASASASVTSLSSSASVQSSHSSSAVISSSTQSISASSSTIPISSSSSSQSASTGISSSSAAASSSSSLVSSSSLSQSASASSSSQSVSASSSSLSPSVSSSSLSQSSSSSSNLVTISSSMSSVVSTPVLSTSAVTPVISVSTLSSDPIQSPLPSSATTNHVLRPVRDPSVDRSSAQNFNPSNVLNLYYADSADPTYHTTIPATLSNGAQGILLENIGALLSLTCSGSQISFTMDSIAAFNDVSSWPVGTILFTLSDGCNTADERGVYVLTGSTSSGTKRQVTGYSVRYTMSQQKIEALVDRWNQIWATATAALAASVAQAQASASVSVTDPSATPSSIPTTQCGGYYPGGPKTVGGVAYNVYCGKMATYPTTRIDDVAASSFEECIKLCNALPNCMGAQFQTSTTNATPCSRWSELNIPRTGGKNWAGRYDVAMKVVEVASSSVSASGWVGGSDVTMTTLVSSSATASASASATTTRTV